MNNNLETLLDFNIPKEKNTINDINSLKSKIKDLNELNKPISSEEYIKLEKENKILLDEEGGLLILPKKEFVLKSIERQNKMKVFINVMSHHAIEDPEETDLIDNEV